MQDFKMTPKVQALMQEQIKKWEMLMNLAVAPVAFAGAITALGSPNERRQLVAWLAIAFVATLGVAVRKEFPGLIRELRARKNRSLVDEIHLRGLEAYYLSGAAMIKRFPALYLGMLLLAATAAGIPDLLGL